MQDSDANGDVAVALDGSFALGPLHGRGADGDPAFIGVAAREAARQRRIAEINSVLDELDREAAQLAADQENCSARRARLDAEREAIPQHELDAVIAAWVEWRILGRELEGLRVRLDLQRAAATTAQQAADAAASVVSQHAREHRLPTDQEGIEALERALEAVVTGIGQSRSSVLRHEHARATHSQHARLHASASRRHEAAEQEALTEAQLAESAEGYASRLAQTIGSTREEVLSEARALTAELEQVERRRDELRDLQLEQSKAEGGFQHQAEALLGELDRLQRAVTDHGRRLAEFDTAGLLVLAIDSERSERAEPWDPERIAATWQAHRERLSAAPEVKTDAVYREFDALRQALDASLPIEISLESAGDMPVVTAAYNTGEQPIAAVAALLESELARQESTLASREEQLFEEFLFGDVARELRGRIADADRIVKAASEKISGVRTSSGLGVDLQWELRPDVDSSVAKVIGLLRRSDPRALPPDQRTVLMSFFRDRLAEARAGEEHASIVEHLQETLDYRGWFRFRIFQVKAGARTELTRRAHSRDSGGEKSVTLHLPLLAAYHALLTGAHAYAPRLVALDEAFAGIDRSGQQQLLAVLDDNFDMDFMLTSEKLWCLEPQVHHLGVYQLRRYEGAPIATVHWRWYGDERRKEMVVADTTAARRV